MLQLEPARTAWDLKCKLAGVPVRIHPLFWLIALWLVYSTDLPFELVLIGMSCIFCSVLVHEFGHALSGRYYGDYQNEVVLYYFGGLCVGKRRLPRVWPNIIHTLWGPGAGLLFCALAAAVWELIDVGWIPPPGRALGYALSMLIWINLIWGLLNLLPIFPLDGGQILREVVQWKAPRRGDFFVFTVSFYAALVMTALTLGLMLAWPRFRSQQSWFSAGLFATLAYSSFMIRRQLGPYGSLEDEQPREAWEQDADWWKK